MNTNDPAAEYKEDTGPSGLTGVFLTDLIMGTGLCDKPLFTTREIVRRCINTLIHEGRLRVVEEVELGDRFNCLGCGTDCSCEDSMQTEIMDAGHKYCPGCSQPIKRKPTNP